MLPGISRARLIRAWAGGRPLCEDTCAATNRDISRTFALFDHQVRDGVPGLLTIVGGKWTTFRLMAEKTVDHACEYLGGHQPCATAHTPVPGAERGYFWLGHRLQEVEEKRLQGELVCECELVTRSMLEEAIRAHRVVTLDDLRRATRLGMGPCQGTFCTYRAVGVLHELADQIQAQGNRDPAGADPDLANPNLLLRDFVQERWKGLMPVLWGRQLQQQRFAELVYLSLLNADHLPDASLASPLSDFWGGSSANA